MRKAVALLALPAITLALGVHLQSARGPGWLFSNLDPDYAYLLNSLLVAEGESAVYCDHPGATLHLLGGCTMRLTNLLVGEGSLPGDVLANPERYLVSYHWMLLVLQFAAVLGAGAVVLGATRSMGRAVLVQTAPLLSMASLRSLGWVRPEPILVAASVLLGALALAAARSPRLLLAAASGIVAGLGVASKITFLPVALLPLMLLAGIRMRLLYAGVGAATFAILVGNPLVKSKWFFIFMGRLATHTGTYGQGAEGVFTWESLWSNISAWAGRIPQEELVAMFVVIALLVALGLTWRNRDRRRALIAVLVVGALQGLMALKSPVPHPRYLLPFLGLIGFGLCLLYDALEGRRRMLAVGLVALVAVAGPLQLHGLSRHLGHLEEARRAADQARAVVEGRPEDERVVYLYAASAKRYALFFGNRFAGRRYARELAALYPDARFYGIWAGTFEDYGGKVEVAEVFGIKRCLVFQGTGRDRLPKDREIEVLLEGPEPVCRTCAR